METHEAIEWLRKRTAWERWLTELHNASDAEAGAVIETLAQRRQRRLPAFLTSDRWTRRSA